MLGESADALWMQPGAPSRSPGWPWRICSSSACSTSTAVKPDFQQRYEYKNAINPFLYDDYTAAHRESELSWMGSIYQSALAAAAQDRGLNGGDAAKIHRGRTLQRRGGRAQARPGRQARPGGGRAPGGGWSGAGDGAKFVDFDSYASSHRPDIKAGADVIALVGAEGDIMTGTGNNDLFGTSANIYSDDVSAALKRASEDKDVKAIVFRVSSPGGGDTASEQILAAVRAAKTKKPVVVSMGTYGASGGYMVSAGPRPSSPSRPP